MAVFLRTVSRRPIYSLLWVYWSSRHSLSTVMLFWRRSTTFDCVCRCHLLVMSLLSFSRHWCSSSTAFSPFTGVYYHTPQVCISHLSQVCIYYLPQVCILLPFTGVHYHTPQVCIYYLSQVCISLADLSISVEICSTRWTPFDHIWAMIWSGARENIARTAL